MARIYVGEGSNTPPYDTPGKATNCKTAFIKRRHSDEIWFLPSQDSSDPDLTWEKFWAKQFNVSCVHGTDFDKFCKKCYDLSNKF